MRVLFELPVWGEGWWLLPQVHIFLRLACSWITLVNGELWFFNRRTQFLQQLYCFYGCFSNWLDFIKLALVKHPQEFNSEGLHLLLVHGWNRVNAVNRYFLGGPVHMAGVGDEVREELVRLRTKSLVNVENKWNEELKNRSVSLEVCLLECVYHLITQLV